LCPKVYLDSLKQAAQAVPADSRVLLDLGCGSGLLLQYLESHLEQGGVYFGTDRLFAGIQAATAKSKTFKDSFPPSVFFVSDMTADWPLRDGSIDAVVAHFSVYTLREKDVRRSVYRRVYSVLKPGGRAIIANPSADYDARQIISSSLNAIEDRNFFADYILRKYLLYPLTYWFGLRYIQKQLRHQVWCAYTRDGLVREIESSGLKVESVDSVYAGSGYLVQAVRPL